MNVTDIEDLTCYLIKSLHKIHLKGFVHGDVKMGNILLNLNPRIYRLADFSLVCNLNIPRVGY